MKQITLYLSLLATLNTIPAHAGIDDWPRLDKGQNIAQCADALQIATSVFQSDAFYLYAPPVVPANVNSVLVLEPAALDISGGDGIKADQAILEKLKSGAENSPRYIYWQKKGTYGRRLIVAEESMGWRGDRYSLFSIRDEISPEHFLSKLANTENPFKPLVADTWRPPLILQQKQSGHLWAIHVDHPYGSREDWQVYVSESDGMKLRCTVRFHPEVATAVELLPAPLQQLEKLLDKTMGKGVDEGTLQPTARIRGIVDTTWANVALRPWALKESYNTREEVDASLMAWSRNGAANAKNLARIHQQYSLAEKSLAEYFQKNFHRSNQDAGRLASHALDIAFRSHYVFHREDKNRQDRNERPNPWRNQ